jgi:hypothetical protein
MPLMAGPAVDDAERLPDRAARRRALDRGVLGAHARPLLPADTLSAARDAG